MDTLTNFTDYVPTPEQFRRMAPIVVAALNELGHAAHITDSRRVPGWPALYSGAPHATKVQAFNIARMAVGLPTFTDPSEHLAYEDWSASRGGDA